MGRNSFEELERELPGIENLNALNASMEHEQQVQRHIEEGNLTPDEVALYIMQNGSTGQKVSMLQHLSRTIGDIDERKISLLLSELCDALWKQDIELQIAAPESLVTILPLIKEQHVKALLAGTKTMLEVRTLEVRKAWNQLALELVAYLPAPVIIQDLVPLALRKGDHSSPNDQRVLCCQLIGRICRRLDSEQVQATVLARAIGLCQDTDVSVRVAMCGQLGEVARSVGLEITKAQITAELFELLVDEEKLVSRAAFTCLIDLVEFFDPPYRREHFYPIIRSYISAPPDEVLSLLIEEFGRFLVKIKSDIQGVEEVTLFATFFRQSAQKSDPEVRRMCAFNLPAVVASLPITAYPMHLTQVTRTLSVDSHPPVRRAIAAGIHEIIRLLGDKAAMHVKEPFLALIQDSSLDVRSMMIQNLAPMLDTLLTQLRPDEKEHFVSVVVPALVGYEQCVQKDWRKVGLLFNAFPSFPSFFPGQVLADKFLPILIRHLHNGAHALKEQCAALIVLFTTSVGNQNTVVDIFAKITNEFGKSTSCYNRISYIRIFYYCTAHFSRKFLRYRMFETVMELGKDPVDSVRLSIARILPQIRVLVKHPVDQNTWDQYMDLVLRLREDASERVAMAIAGVILELDEIDREFSRQQALRVTDAPDDVADRQRELAEGPLIELAKEQEKLERRQKLKELLKSERDAGFGAEINKKTGGGVGVGGKPLPGRGAGLAAHGTSYGHGGSSTSLTAGRSAASSGVAAGGGSTGGRGSMSATTTTPTASGARATATVGGSSSTSTASRIARRY